MLPLNTEVSTLTWNLTALHPCFENMLVALYIRSSVELIFFSLKFQSGKNAEKCILHYKFGFVFVFVILPQ